MNIANGFSLLQTLLVLVLISAITLFAIADWGDGHGRHAAEQYAARLHSMLLRARSEAVQGGGAQLCPVMLKGNFDIQGCERRPLERDGGFVWSGGILLFQDQAGGRAGIYDSKEALAVQALGRGITLLVSQPRLAIAPSGVLAGGQSVWFRFTSVHGYCRQLTLSVPFRTELAACTG